MKGVFLLVLCFVCCFVLCGSALWGLPSSAWAQGSFVDEKSLVPDFDPHSSDWNGTKNLVHLASSQDITLNFRDTLEYDKLKINTPVFILHPIKELATRSLAKFIVEGGHVVVADDFGASASFLKRLDLSKLEPIRGMLPHGEFVDKNPSIPLLRPKGVHPLLEGVKLMVANHPAVLHNVGGPVVPYSEDGGLVYDMNLGQGKAIAIADSSLFINQMIGLADNDAFIRNLMLYMCQESKTCQIDVYVGNFIQHGSYGTSKDRVMHKSFGEDITAFNEALYDWMKQIPTRQLFYYLGLLLSLGLILYLYTIFPMRHTRPYSAYLTDMYRTLHPPQSEFDWNLSRFVQGHSTINYALPVSILKELFEELFLTEIGMWNSSDESARGDVKALGKMFRDKYLKMHASDKAQRVESQVVDLLATFAKVPTRHRVFLDSDTFFGEKDLLGLHERSLEVLELMGLRDAYERRTRDHV